MVIKIQYFSLLKDLKGPESIEMKDGSSVGDLLNVLCREVPDLENWNKRMLIAAGIEWVPRDYVMRPGDVISLMPPVQGG
ncbi:MAG: thiamine S protein [Acidobacteria bacterium]|nr:MAG: thiamine S protein [Acidobacteriota bacterium]